MSPSEHIDTKIAGLDDWRGEMCVTLRQLINEVDPQLKEDWKWSTAVWTCGGLVCALGVFKDHVKLNFFKGNLLRDPHGLLNAGMDSKEHRAIDWRKDDAIDEAAVKGLVREAITLNKKVY